MIRVTCAIIRNEDSEVLIVRRDEKSDHPLKWEFPGGKINEGESEEECIIREIREELGMDIVICSRMDDVEYDYGEKYIVLIPFVCDTLDELPILSEHAAFRWLEPSALAKVDFSEADIIVAENYLKNLTAGAPGTDDIPVFPDQTDAAFEKEFRDVVSGTMSTREVEWLAASADENPVIFRKLLEYSFSEDKKLAFRSSWALSKVCDRSVEQVYQYLDTIIGSLDRLDNESARRSFLRILTLVDMNRLSTGNHGLLAEHCFNALRSGFSAIAVKAYSMEIIYRLALIYPELSHELAAVISMLQGEGSAGIIARGKMILKRISGIRKS